VNERQILIAARDLNKRSRTTGRHLAETADGVEVRPVDSRAERFSPIGAICHLAPWQSRDGSPPWADATEAGEQAAVLLNDAARSEGYRCATHAAITGGPAVEDRVFARAITRAHNDRRVTR